MVIGKSTFLKFSRIFSQDAPISELQRRCPEAVLGDGPSQPHHPFGETISGANLLTKNLSSGIVVVIAPR
jgi:hypothetical protein